MNYKIQGKVLILSVLLIIFLSKIGDLNSQKRNLRKTYPGLGEFAIRTTPEQMWTFKQYMINSFISHPTPRTASIISQMMICQTLASSQTPYDNLSEKMFLFFLRFGFSMTAPVKGGHSPLRCFLSRNPIFGFFRIRS